MSAPKGFQNKVTFTELAPCRRNSTTNHCQILTIQVGITHVPLMANKVVSKHEITKIWLVSGLA